MDIAFLSISGNHYQLPFPSCIDDLTPAQFMAVSHIKCTGTDKKRQVMRLLMQSVGFTRLHLWNIVCSKWNTGQYMAAINALSMMLFFQSPNLWVFFNEDDVIDALPSIDWLFSKSAPQKKSKVATIRHRRTTYDGPRNKLTGLVWKQMQLADAIADNFAKTHNEDLLNDLAAVLYVPQNGRFNAKNSSVNNRIKRFADLSMPLKYAIYTNYIQLRDSFYKSYDLPKNEIATTGRPDWIAVTLSVAENGSLGPYDKVEKAPANVVMKFFEKAHQDDVKNRN